MYSYGPPHMAVQKQDDQHEHTFSSYVRIQDVVLKTCLGRSTIGRSGERGSGISVLPARHDDDDGSISIIDLFRLFKLVRWNSNRVWILFLFFPVKRRRYISYYIMLWSIWLKKINGFGIFLFLYGFCTYQFCLFYINIYRSGRIWHKVKF